MVSRAASIATCAKDPAITLPWPPPSCVACRHEGIQANWHAKLAAYDAEAGGRVWRTTAAGFRSGAGHDGAGDADTPAHLASAPLASEEHKSPENYYWTYRKRGLFAVGIVRAIRNIGLSHASDYVADGSFASLDAVHRYFLDAFPWLLMEVLKAQEYLQHRGPGSGSGGASAAAAAATAGAAAR